MHGEKTILLLYRNKKSIPDEIIQTAKDKVPTGFRLVVCDETEADETRRELIRQASYIIAYTVKFNDFDIADSVKIFQLLSAGFDTLDIDQFKNQGIPVCNNGGVNATTVAEHVVLLILSLFKRLPVHHQKLQQGVWLGHQHALQLRELKNKKVGILGFGHIGQEVARKLSGFDVELTYFDPCPVAADIEKRYQIKRIEFIDLIKNSDIITVHLPLFEKTKGLIGKTEFDLMKASAIIINTARGPIVDEAALVEALDSGKLAGAGLDVYTREPLEADSPLIGRENVVVTPHIAGTTIDNWFRRLDFSYENILRVEAGKEPLARVDK